MSKKYTQILREAVDTGIVSIADYNAGIECFVVYRIVWENKAHEILYPFPDEDAAIKFINGREDYYYSKLTLMR